MRKAAESDVHLEADIHAMANNPNGFKEGDWIPYLHVKYELTKLPSGEVMQGDMMPMVANGSHYGDNVKLKGPGKYKVKFIVLPPNAKDNPQGNHFGRHKPPDGRAPLVQALRDRMGVHLCRHWQEGGY